MKLNKAPCGVTLTVPISKGNTNGYDREDCVKGGILKGTKYSWLCHGPFLKIIDVSSGEKVAGWRFGAACSDFVTEVSCALELPNSGDSNLKQIVLGLECEVIGGLICLFDVQGSRLLRAIRIPDKPLSLSIVDSGSSGCEGCYPLPGLLSSMSGIIAVGLQGGSVFLIDLCRLACEELLNTWFNDDREEVRDEINPCQLLPINKDDDDSDKLEKKCASAVVSGDHLCLLLNEGAFVQDNFLLFEPGGEVIACQKIRNIGVTSLLYVPRIASLIVGYSFGCFQIWNLMHLTLNYTSHMMKDPLPVRHLGFQEPSDDPCNFCYLWAVHSSTDEFPSSNHPVGIMYALSYDSKEWIDGYGYLYQDYQSCHFRFEYNLEVDGSEDVDSVCCVTFSTLSNIATQRMPEDGYDEEDTENDFSLSVFAWEAYDTENKPISTYLSIFDLNQWYKDQMPVRITGEDDESLGYLVTFSMNCIRQMGETTSHIETPLLDIQIDPKNLSQFKSFQPQEEHFHPSALSFVSNCLLEDKVVFVSHPGLQHFLLLCMEKEGPICLLRPVNLFKHCVMVGLKPLLMDINGLSEVSAATQREFLLSIALENQMLGFLHKCASDWANGSVSGADCSLPMLLSWGFERACILKNTGNSLCIHLFDHTGVRLDKNECKLLDNCATQLRQLATLFEGIMSDCRLISLLDLDEFKEKTNALNLFALYFEVLQWFLNVGLLPEFPENYFDQVPSETCDTSFQKIPYPSTVLTKFYSDRRLEFRNLNVKNGTKARLYIDQLLENECSSSELVRLWQNDGGSGMYPPPSIQSLLAMFLLDGIDVQTKNSIVIYVFLDLASILDSERYSRTIEYFVKFPCAFCMTPSIIKVTQAFWLLDQKLFEDALDMVLDPLVSPKDLQPWQHRFMVHALLSQGQHCKALEYFTVRQLPIQGIEDIQLKISLLVMNKQVTQAYNFLQQYNIEENNKKLLYHFYQECGKARQLGTVLKLMLSPAEEELLMSYLQNCNIAQSEDMQVVFYLMRSRVIEAVAVNEKINFSGCRKVGARRIRNDPTIRDVLVRGYAKTLPSVTRQLANYCSQQKKLLSHWRQVQRPTPMSVDVNYGTKQPVSYKSSLIHATLEKARETWMVSDHSSYNAEARNKEMDVSAMQNLPFLCTTHDSFRHERETTPVVFPSVTNSIKRQLEEDEMVSTPFKRSRLDSSPLMENFLLPNKKKDICEKEHNNSSLLLKSPLVKRITPLKRMNDTSQQENSVSKPYTESFTPQSILKVRNLVRSSVSPEHTHKESEEKVSKVLQCGKQGEERLCARQIRFSLPVSNELEECQPLSSSTPSAGHNKIKSPNRIVNASPRLPLRSSLSLLQKRNGGVNIETSLTNVPEKNLELSKNAAEDKSLENDIFIFHSEENSDEIYVKDGKSKLNDSLEEESFHSAPSSNNSLIVEEDSGTDPMNDDENTGTSHSPKNFIHNIKEIKSRKQLPRLKSVTQHTDSQIPKTNVNILENIFSAEKTSVEMQITTRNSFEKKVMQCSFIPESSFDAKSDISFKKSILGDTNFIENSGNSSTFSYEQSISTSRGNDSLMKSISGNEKSEISEETEGHLVTKIEHIKARRPLSRIRKSGNFDETLGNSQLEKSSFLETTKDKEEDILPDYSNINFSFAEMDEENLEKEDGTFVGDNVPKTSDLYQERNEIQFSEEMKGSSSLTFSTSKENTIKCVNSTVEDEKDMHITQISPNLIQDTSFQDSRDVLFLSEGKSNEDFVTVGEKTYASLSAVTTEHSSCESVFPNHNENHSSVHRDLPEDPRIVFPDREIAEKTYSAQFTQIHPRISIHESLVMEGDEEVCVNAVYECVKPDVAIDNYSKVATFSGNLKEQGSSSTGDTSGTIELDSDESEDNKMCSKTIDTVLAIRQENQEEIKHNSEKLIDSNLDIHSGISTSGSFEERSSYSVVGAQLMSPSKMAVSDSCVPTSNVNETSYNVLEFQKIGQSSFGTSHKPYSLRSSMKTQMNVSTTEVAETSVKDQINQQSIADSQDNVSQVGGLRRIQNSIHIEPIIGDPALEQKVEHVSTKKTRQRSHLNSVQSELPLISDIPSTESSANHVKSYGQMEKPRRRRSSLQIEPVSRGDGITPENKGVEETYYLRTRSKGRSSSIQSEPPQMSDVLGMDQKVLTPLGSSRQRRHSLQIDTMQMRAESTFAERGEITENNSTSRRQKGRSNSVQSEPPIMSDVLLNDDFSKHRRRRRGSLQEGPVNISREQIIEDKAEAHSNSVLNPSSVKDDLLEAENKGAENIIQEPLNYQEGLRASLHSKNVQVVGPFNSSSEKCIAVESSSNSSEPSAQNVSTSCLTNKNNSLLNTAFIENQKSKMVLRSCRAFSLEKGLPGVEDGKKASDFPDLDDSPLNTAFIKSEKLKIIGRSSRASSMDRDLQSVEDGKKTSDFSDSDNCSVQSEPPRLHDVSRTRHSKNLKPRRVSVRRRNSSKKSTYVLKIPSPKLPCVKEEPENETSAGNADEINPSARLQSEIYVEESIKCERRKKQSQSVRGHTKSAEEGLIVPKAPSDDADSPTSISSKSTLILDHSSKRKRSSSPSSEEQELKKFQRDNDIPAVSRNVEKSKKKSVQDSNSSDTIEQYATARRLTRYQKTLMERSNKRHLTVTKGIYQEFQGRHHHSYKLLEDSDGESEASSYSSGSSIIRSSARLREKQRMTERSPSQSSEMSTRSAQTPEKRLSKRHSLKQISPEGRGDKSPLSVRSGKSSCGSSVSSSQWPSPDPALTQSPMRPRRKSFQNAQKALYSPAKKHGSTKSSVTSDSSEGVGQSVHERKLMKNTGTASDVGNIQSPSSSSSSPIFQTRNTRPSTKNKKHSKHGAEVQSHKKLAQNEDSNTSVSSVETSPQKET